jgi:hypothetical protein
LDPSRAGRSCPEGEPQPPSAEHERAARLFQVGRAAELRGDRDAARAAYQQALRLAPDHTDARAGLERLATAAPPTRPLDAPYEILVRNPSPTSQHAAAALAALSFDLRPTLTANLDRLLLAALPLVVGIALLYLVRQPTAPHLPPPTGAMGLVLVFVGVALVAFVVLSVRAGRIALAGGRLRLTTGLRQHITNVELWRVREVRLDRSPLNRVTGDGTLVLLINRGPHATPSELRVVGLARGRQLRQLFDRISELVKLLRGSVLGPEG